MITGAAGAEGAAAVATGLTAGTTVLTDAEVIGRALTRARTRRSSPTSAVGRPARLLASRC